jgi:hypothetical protein
MGICSFCLGDENKNAKGVPEDMIDCAECGNCGKKVFVAKMGSSSFR